MQWISLQVKWKCSLQGIWTQVRPLVGVLGPDFLTMMALRTTLELDSKDLGLVHIKVW
jgi:hypothetical protein